MNSNFARNDCLQEFLAERIKIPEGLFDLNYLRNMNTQGLMTMAQVAYTAAGMCDIDIRPVSLILC